MTEKTVKISSTGGVSFLTILTILFIGLKLGNVGAVASWSWWWVLSPLWIPFAAVNVCIVLFFIIVVIIAIIMTLLEVIQEKIDNNRW